MRFIELFEKPSKEISGRTSDGTNEIQSNTPLDSFALLHLSTGCLPHPFLPSTDVEQVAVIMSESVRDLGCTTFQSLTVSDFEAHSTLKRDEMWKRWSYVVLCEKNR